MKFKSIQSLLDDAKNILERFPLAMACAFTGTVAMIILTDRFYSAQKDLWFLSNLTMVCALGIPLFLSLKVFAETHDGKNDIWVLRGWGLLILVVYFFLLPKHLKGIDTNRYGLLEADVHLLVAIAPFLFLLNQTNAFWQYNKTLFLRFILAFIYSNTIYIGLAIAIGVTDYLFEFIKFKETIYFHLWIGVVGIFNTWFFLGGVPKNINDLEEDRSYPRGLRIFTQFVLIPLVLLYLGILYLYMAKIIFTWSLPKGWLSSFVIGAATLGILTLLLVHPLTDKEEHSWFKIYRRYFYLALFPLIILMAVAVGRRIIDYGMTEQRYFILIFTAWLWVVALRFSIKPKTDIRSIPITLCVLIVVATWGPWSAMAVSKRSQIARLKNILTENSLLKNGVLIKALKPIKIDDNRELCSIVYYLEQNFGLQVLEMWSAPDVSVFRKDLSANDFVTKTLGLEFIGEYRGYGGRGDGNNYFYLYTIQNPVIKVAGYDYYAPFNVYGGPNRPESPVTKIPTSKGELEIWFNPATGLLSVQWNGRRIPVVEFSESWKAKIKEKYGTTRYNLPAKEFVFKSLSPDINFEVTLQNISGTLGEKDKPLTVTNIQGSILFSVQKKVQP